MLEQGNDQYERESQCQDYSDYGPEGYHPVVLGQKFNQKYIVIQKLGWGHFSTVWLVLNESTNEYCAMKVQRSKQQHAQSALDELQILSEIRKHQSNQNWSDFLKNLESQYPELIKSNLCRPLLLLDNFPHYGIHGKHYCSVFQILGPNLLDVIQHYEHNQERMPLWLVKKIAIDTLLGLVYMHQHCNIIHTDLKPQNIMIKLQPHEQAQLLEQIKAYNVKPISMKYLKNIQTSKNSKNKKKKLKKKKKKEQQGGNQNQAQPQPLQDQSSKNQLSNNKSSSPMDLQASSNIKISQQKSQKVPQNQGQKLEQKQVQKQVQKLLPQVLVQEKPFQSSKQLITQLANNKTESLEPTNKTISQQWNPYQLKWKNVSIDLNCKIFFKIVDMGNACFADKHFTDGVQTRQYRAPEVILGHQYVHNTDVWSLGCTIFELMTNNFLFKAKKTKGISKDQDHLFKMLEVLGPMSKQFATGGTYSSQTFNKKGKLIHRNPLKTLPISKLLIQDYGYDPLIAKQTEQFLLPLLSYQPKNRISAKDCLKSKWLWK